jgi:hypothetical protein
MTTVVVLLAVGFTIYSLWVRRITWSCRWEISATMTVAAMGLGMLLVCNAINPFMDATLYQVLHWRNIENLLGHVCMVFAAAGAVYVASSRVVRETKRARILRIWVDIPAALSVIAMVATFAAGQATQLPSLYTDNIWMLAYQNIVASAVIYLLAVAAKMLLIVRRDPRHNPTANIYLWACVAGICGFGYRAIAITYFAPTPHTSLVAVGLIGLWVAGFAAAAAGSWQRKTRQLTLPPPVRV